METQQQNEVTPGQAFTGAVIAATVAEAVGQVLEAITESFRSDVDGTLQPMASSMIAAAGYDRGTSELIVEFVHGRIYRYQGVPLNVWDQLITAGSKGSFMRQVVIPTFAYT